MVRAQVLIEEWQHARLKSLADRSGKSISELLREILGERLGPRRSRKGGLEAIAGIESDAQTSGREHDLYLYGRKR